MIPLSAYELSDLYDAVSARIDGALMPALARANRTGDLPQLLDMLLLGDLMDPMGLADVGPKKIVVIGDSQVPEGKLRSMARSKGFEAADFEFALGYNELKHYNFRKLRDTTLYRAILIGPMPHSTRGKGEASSFAAEAKRHPEDYPTLLELRDSTGLKITNNSFVRALDELR